MSDNQANPANDPEYNLPVNPSQPVSENFSEYTNGESAGGSTKMPNGGQAGGRRHRSSRKSASKKNRSKKHGGKKHGSKKHRSKKHRSKK